MNRIAGDPIAPTAKWPDVAKCNNDLRAYGPFTRYLLGRSLVAAMTHSASASHLGPEFNDFLFAPIGEAGNGMPLSVLSALARLDVDPWQEAAELARLPGETAIHRLAALIRALPDGPSTHPDPKTTAARLVAFLPRGPRSVGPTYEALPAFGAATRPRLLSLYMMILMVFMLGAQLFLAARQPPVHVGHSQMSAADKALPKVPSPRSVQ